MGQKLRSSMINDFDDGVLSWAKLANKTVTADNKRSHARLQKIPPDAPPPPCPPFPSLKKPNKLAVFRKISLLISSTKAGYTN